MFIHPDGQLLAQTPQAAQDDLFIVILKMEYFEINPKIAPTGQIFVQKNLFLKNTNISTAVEIIIPIKLKLNAFEKIVYGSTYLITIVLPPISTLKQTKATMYHREFTP